MLLALLVARSTPDEIRSKLQFGAEAHEPITFECSTSDSLKQLTRYAGRITALIQGLLDDGRFLGGALAVRLRPRLLPPLFSRRSRQTRLMISF